MLHVSIGRLLDSVIRIDADMDATVVVVSLNSIRDIALSELLGAFPHPLLVLAGDLLHGLTTDKRNVHPQGSARGDWRQLRLVPNKVDTSARLIGDLVQSPPIAGSDHARLVDDDDVVRAKVEFALIVGGDQSGDSEGPIRGDPDLLTQHVNGTVGRASDPDIHADGFRDLTDLDHCGGLASARPNRLSP